MRMEPNSQNDTTAANSTDHLEKLREEIERREDLLAFREKELLPLREEVSTLRTRLLQASATAGVFLFLLTIVGLHEWWNLPKTVTTEVSKQVAVPLEKQTEKMLRFNEELQAAVELAKKPDEYALTILKRLANEQRERESELLFSYLTEYYIKFDKCPDGYRHLKELEASGLLKADKLKMPMSLRNYAFLVWVHSLDSVLYGVKVNKAAELLERSLNQAEEVDDDDGIRTATEFLVLLYLSRDEKERAKDLADKYLGIYEPNWKKYVRKEWFKKLTERRPDIEKNLREMFPRAFTQAKAGAKTQ